MGEKPHSTRLISDFPATKDSFGGHQEVANALAQLFKEEKGGKSIALSGSFGSGKSTVIKLLEQNLADKSKVGASKDGDYKIFTYDAWKHQKDPLRRSFIEELHSFLKNEVKWIGDEYDKDIETLQKRREETENTTESSLTTFGKIAAIGTFLAPVVILFVTHLISNILDPNINAYFAFGWSYETWFLITFITFWVLPILIVLGIWIYNNRKTGDEDFDPFNIFIKKTVTIDRTKTVRYPDPTSIEFRKIFGDLVEGALDKSNLNLVIVIDNLDRLPPERGLEVWSGLLAFLNQQNLNQFVSKDNIWVITPFDFKKLDGILEKIEPFDLKTFIDKTFQVVFRIAKPVIIDWKAFLEDTLGQAFPDINSQKSHRIYRLFQIISVQEQGNGLPTPREIKRFVNDLSALYRRWKGEISITTLAFYNLISDQLQDCSKPVKIVDQYEEKTNILSLLDEKDWKENIFAIHYNVVPKKAYHIILSEPIYEALSNSDEEKLNELANNQGFYEVLEDVIDQQISPAESTVYHNSIVTLNKLGLAKKPSHQNSWNTLATKLKYLDKLQLNKPIGKGLGYLLDHNKILYESLLNKSIKLLNEYNLAEENKDNEIKAWGETVFQLIEHVRSSDKTSSVQSKLLVPFDASDYLELLGYLSFGDYDKELFKFLKTPHNSTDLVAELRRRLNDNNLTYEDARLIPNLNLIEGLSNIDWQNFINDAGNKLKESGNIDADLLGSTSESLIHLKISYANANTDTVLRNDQDNGNLLNRYYPHREDVKCTTRIILLQLLVNPSIRIQNTGNAQNSRNEIISYLNKQKSKPKITSEFKEITKQANAVDSILEVYVQQEYPLIETVLRELVDEGTCYRFVDAKSVQENFDKWVKVLDEDRLKSFVKSQISFNELVEYLIRNNSFELGEHQLMDLVVRLTPKEIQKPQIIKFVADKILEIETLQWYEILTKETNLLDLLQFLERINQFPDLNEGFENAFEDLNKELCDNLISSPEKSEIIQNICKAHFGEDELVNRLLLVLNKTNSEDTTNFLETYSIFLITSKQFESKANLLLGEIFPKMLSQINKNELIWMRKAFDNTNIYDNAGRSEKLAFNDKLRQEYFDSGHDSEINDLIESIANSAGIDLHNSKKYPN